MTLLEDWEREKRQIEAGLADGRMEAGTAARALAHLDRHIQCRPRILKRRHDRKAWRKAQTAKLLSDVQQRAQGTK